jgi:hypothetical protein
MALAPRTDNPAKDMARVMAIVREYSDARLADVLSGKDMSVPQFAAMTEAMGRKQLRQAVDGQQAQQQAQQPSIKEQLLAEQSAPQMPQMAAGIDQLPAANMESMDMASGGIIAFEEGGNVPGFYAGGDPRMYDEEGNYIPLDKRNAATNQNIPINRILSRFFSEEGKKQAGIESLRRSELDPRARRGDQPGDYPMYTPNPVTTSTTPPPAPPPAPPAGAAAPKSLIDISQPTKFERRASPFGEMSAEPVDIEGLKNRGLGEGLMRLSAGLLSAPGSKGVSAGIAGLAEQAGLTRKETNALKKDARDYELNRTRAEAEFERGNDELGLKYTEAANLNKYRMDSLAQEPGELRTARAALKDPEIAKLLRGKNTGVVSRTDALKEWNDLAPGDKRKMKDLGVTDFNSYYSYLSTGLPSLQVVGTIPGKDAVVRN